MSKEQELKKILKLYSKQDLWNRIQEKQSTIYDLQSQLAEKEKEIEKLKGIKIIPAPINGEDTKKFLKNLDRQYFIVVDSNGPQIKVLNQNQKAIEQLEKVKETLIQNADEIGEEYKEDYFMISLGNVKNIIDNQIEELKKEMK